MQWEGFACIQGECIVGRVLSHHYGKDDGWDGTAERYWRG